MGDSKGFVQVQVADISPNQSRRGQTHLSIHVSAIHVHLATMLMDGAGYLHDSRLIDAMGRRIGNHQSSQLITILFSLTLEVL